MTTLPIMSQIPERKRTLASAVDPTFCWAGRLLPTPGFHQLRDHPLVSDAMAKSTSFLTTSPEPAAGSSLDGTSEWSTPVRIGASLEPLDRDGEHVLIDAPALLGVADPVVVASQADGVILVVGAPRHWAEASALGCTATRRAQRQAGCYGREQSVRISVHTPTVRSGVPRRQSPFRQERPGNQ